MEALIIAAGDGGRLGDLTKDKPKPLIQLLGLSLIERTVLTAKQADIHEFLIVVGYRGDKIKEKLGDGERLGVKIDYIQNKEWQKEENGASVLKAKEALNENFVLLMSDHIFDDRILNELVKCDMKSSVVLAVDRKEPCKEDTKVLERNGKIVDIGKNIRESNCVDTGIFLCSPKIFSYIEEAANEKKGELRDSIKKAAKNGDAEIFDITKIESYPSKMRKNIELWWTDIDTQDDLKKASDKLITNLKKTSDGPVSRYLNRPISIIISKYLVKTSISPNSISFFPFIISMLGAYFFFLGGYVNLVIGGILAQISSIVDGCDGEVARLTFQATTFGGWFDAVLDRYADGFLLFSLTYYVYPLNNNFLYIAIGFLAIMGSFMNSYTADKYYSLRNRLLNRRIGSKDFSFRIRRDVRTFIIFVGALINQPLLTLILIGTMTNLENIRRVIVLYKNK